jgi:thiamine-monophosphate kinase
MDVEGLGEDGILKRLFPLLPQGSYTLIGTGDDCAVVSAPGQRFAVTTDVLVEGEHFKNEWSSGFEVGARAAAQNLADVAAMGATPTALVVGLVVPANTDIKWLEDFAKGLANECDPLGVGVVGGDLTRGPSLVVAVTAHGALAGNPVLRSGARPGDVIAIAGTLGLSDSGLSWLLGQGGKEENVPIYKAPRPPYAAGPAAAKSGATAMMDVSDGLVRDSGRLAKASSVTMSFDSALLEPYVQASGSLKHVLYGGEDHSMLATFPADSILPDGFRLVGIVIEEGPHAVLIDGAPVGGGWDHFE